MLFIMSTFAAITEASRFQFPDQSYLYTILRITSQRIFNTNKCCNINTWSFPDPISSTYIPQEWKHCWATVYVNCVRRLHGGPLFSVPLCRPSWQQHRVVVRPRVVLNLGEVFFGHFSATCVPLCQSDRTVNTSNW